jgi:hypothetical protein
VHDYDSDVSSYVQQVHGWMDSTGHSNYPLWLSEWGTYTGGYDNVSTGVKLIINNLIRMSGGTSSQVNGSHLFSFYDWNGFSGKLQNFQGLVDASGDKRASYYTLRMAVRALLGRPAHLHQQHQQQQPRHLAHRPGAADKARQHSRRTVYATRGLHRSPLHARTITTSFRRRIPQPDLPAETSRRTMERRQYRCGHLLVASLKDTGGSNRVARTQRGGRFTAIRVDGRWPGWSAAARGLRVRSPGRVAADTVTVRDSKRFAEPLALPGSCPLYVRDQWISRTHDRILR